MGALFSKRKAVTDVDKAILSLRTQKRKLAEYQKKVGAVIEREKEVVRQMVKEGKKDRALLALKKKKLQEDALGKSDAWVLRVEQQLADIEITSRQAQVFESLKAGHMAIQELQKEISLEDVEKLMGESEDAKAFQDEVAAMLAGALSEEAELAALAELEALETELALEEVQQEMPAVPEVPVLPDVPKEPPVKAPVEGEEEKESAAVAEAEAEEETSRERVREEPLPA
ncbi:hypothetical protein CLOM_g20463 [Closterium sp. NIES-68]|nr:hypothetical protein CLOM_g20463 [Closterium sp. NIES-68]